MGGERDMSHKGGNIRQKGVGRGEKGTRETEGRDIKQNNSRNLEQRKRHRPQRRRQERKRRHDPKVRVRSQKRGNIWKIVTEEIGKGQSR